jgi:hypothetical protein
VVNEHSHSRGNFFMLHAISKRNLCSRAVVMGGYRSCGYCGSDIRMVTMCICPFESSNFQRDIPFIVSDWVVSLRRVWGMNVVLCEMARASSICLIDLLASH